MPPCDTKISGKPESGISPKVEAMFINDWPAIITTSPTTRSPPKGSGARAAMRSPKSEKAANKRTRTTQPIQPNSSPATANIESPMGSGRYGILAESAGMAGGRDATRRARDDYARSISREVRGV